MSASAPADNSTRAFSSSICPCLGTSTKRDKYEALTIKNGGALSSSPNSGKLPAQTPTEATKVVNVSEGNLQAAVVGSVPPVADVVEDPETSMTSVGGSSTPEEEEQKQKQRQKDKDKKRKIKAKAKERCEKFTKDDEIYGKRINRREQDLRNSKNEIYQLLGFYFVFQGVLIQGVSQLNRRQCGFAWIPTFLSLIASVAAFYGVKCKLDEKRTIEIEIQYEKWQQRAITQWQDDYESLVEGKTTAPGFHPLTTIAKTDKVKEDTSKDGCLYFLLHGSSEIRYMCAMLILFSGLVVAYCMTIICHI